MAPSIPTTEPETLIANTSATWSRSSSDYPASDGWTLRYYFRGASTIDVAATASGADHLVVIAPADTAGKDAGTYPWSSFFEKGAERWPDRTGVLVLAADPLGTASEAPFAEQMVRAIEARLAGRTEADIESHGVAGRQVNKIPYEKLNYYLGIWNAKLWRIRNPGKSFPQHVVRSRAVR